MSPADVLSDPAASRAPKALLQPQSSRSLHPLLGVMDIAIIASESTEPTSAPESSLRSRAYAPR